MTEGLLAVYKYIRIRYNANSGHDMQFIFRSGFMNEITITNRNNIYQKFEVLKTNRNKRYKYNEFLVEGVRSLNEAVSNGWNIKSLVYNRSNLSGWARDMISKVKTQTNYNLDPLLLKELSGKGDTSS